MKHILLSALFAAGLFLAGCNDISTDDRYTATDAVEPRRAVLIEDFTGQNCVNCPKAHTTIEKLAQQYGDAVIAVSIHAGGFGIPADNKRYTGLMQPEGDTYNDMWGINEWPKGVVNRTSGATNHDEWPGLVKAELERTSPLSLAAEAATDGENIDIEIKFQPDADIDGMLQVWITEDGIVARQEDIDLGRITDYVHNHVYRASVNGVGGQSVKLRAHFHDGLALSCPVRKTATETWNADNLSVVAFVYDASGVIQATRCHVTNIGPTE